MKTCPRIRDRGPWMNIGIVFSLFSLADRAIYLIVYWSKKGKRKKLYKRLSLNWFKFGTKFCSRVVIFVYHLFVEEKL